MNPLTHDNRDLSAQAEAQHSEIEALRRKVKELAVESNRLMDSVRALERRNAALRHENDNLLADLRVAKQSINDALETLGRLTGGKAV